MLFDKQNLFSDAQAITADAASTNIIDARGEITNEVGFGQGIPLRIQCVEGFTGTGITSLEIKVQTDDNESFSSATTIATTGAITGTNLVAGYVAPILFIPAKNEGYLRLYYDITLSSGGSVSKGKITAGIVNAHDFSFQDM